MGLGVLATAVFLILFGVTTLGWIAISATVLGVVAFIAGLVILLDGYGVLRR